MPNFDAELDRLADDTVTILGSRTVTLRQPGTTTLNAATRQRETGTFTEYEVSAIRGEDLITPVGIGDGSARVVRCTFIMRAADLTDLSAPVPARGWRLVDATVEWQVTEVRMDVDGKQVEVVCTRAF